MPSFAEKLDDLLVRYLAYFNYMGYVDRLDLLGKEIILEVGCGGGNLSRFLAEKIPLGKLVCVDNSEYCIKKAKRRLEGLRNIEFNSVNILNFDRENYFDVLVIHYVLHDVKERKKVIDILYKGLKAKGVVHIREPTRKNHGMPSTEIEELMFSAGLKKLFSQERHSFPIRGKVYEGIFKK